MQQPPLLPEVVLARVMRTALINGLSVFLMAALFASARAIEHDIPFVAVGLLAAAAGAIELHGLMLLRQRDPGGTTWLIAAQPLLLVVILGYCGLRVTHLTGYPEHLRAVREIIELSAQQMGMSLDDYWRYVIRLSMQILAVAAVFYQGFMMFYYIKSRASVARALEAFEGESD